MSIHPWNIVGDHVENCGYLRSGPDIRFLTGEIPAVLDAIAICLGEDHAPPPLYAIACLVWMSGIEKSLEFSGESIRPPFIHNILHAAELALMAYPPQCWSDKEVVDCMASECAEVRQSCLVFLAYRQTA